MQPARIAIVDDDTLFVGYLSTLLQSRGYRSTVYSNGAALLHDLSSGPPDVVLLDVLMPNMDGLETLRALRAASPNMPVIMVSGQQVPATIVDAVRLGAIDYVIKPDDASGIHEAALESAICRAVERVRLNNEVTRLTAHVSDDPEAAHAPWSASTAMRGVATMVDRVADSDVTVLLTGESGVGKEVVARELHRRSARRLKPFVKVNCAALPSELLESELFGHDRGAFTGAQAPRVGKFEFASGGTIMLDEIGEMPLPLQAKLLQVLQDGEITRLGSNRPIVVDARVVAATNRDFDVMLKAGQFRADLYYRLRVIEIAVPPLRARVDEIPILTDVFLQRYSERYGRPALKPSNALRSALAAHDWPGNVRELENMMKRFVILRDEESLLAELQREAEVAAEPNVATDAPPPVAAIAPPPKTPAVDADRTAGLRDVARIAALKAQREAIEHALAKFRWNRRKTAELLGVSYKTLLVKMKECGISTPAGLESEDA